ncbi:hypothetical protein ACTNEO_00435 [Gracilibacillus sp. HCP3S3_G5_1]|uniref:hypothetical protein n=1 Tax=unclassified Gracilibacillus TaxID=2625209 RepID=UPI003F8A48C3
MKEFLSKDIYLHERLTIQQLLAIHTYQKRYHGDIYLVINYETITLENLPKLVSFSLTMNPKCKLQIIVEGENARKALNELTRCIQMEEYHIAN